MVLYSDNFVVAVDFLRKNLDGSSRQACRCLSMDCSIAFLGLPHIALVLVLEV